MTIKQFIRNVLLNDTTIDFYDLPYECMGPEYINNWPEVLEPDIDSDLDGATEPLDLENFEWLSLEEEKIIVACGGDWQEPMILTIEMVNDHPTVTEQKDGFQEGLDEEQFYYQIENLK